jgi:RNA polymerase sigma-70 factor (ECF subfamily)
MDADSAEWLRVLSTDGPRREEGLARLHGMLLRIARNETYRRGPRLRLAGPELDDVAHQAAADALLAIIRKLDQFRGESRFTTWAYRFVVLEVSGAVGRHFWREPGVRLDAQEWERLPDRFGVEPDREADRRALLDAVRAAVDNELTDRQRAVFVAIVVDGVPLDALAHRLGTSRGAIYKTLFDARRKIRAALVANGQLDDAAGGGVGPDPARRP